MLSFLPPGVASVPPANAELVRTQFKSPGLNRVLRQVGASGVEGLVRSRDGFDRVSGDVCGVQPGLGKQFGAAAMRYELIRKAELTYRSLHPSEAQLLRQPRATTADHLIVLDSDYEIMIGGERRRATD